MLIKVEEYGMYDNLFFRCPHCQRHFSTNARLPRAPWLRTRLLSMMDKGCCCDDCAKPVKSGAVGEKPAGRMEA